MRCPKNIQQNLLIFLFCIAVMAGPAMTTLLSYDDNARNCVDCKSYLTIAQLHADTIAVRRYRVIVPLLAAGVNTLKPVWQYLTPHSFTGDFTLPFSFYLVNLCLFGILGVVIYNYCRSWALGFIESVLGLCLMLTNKWTAFLIGNPLADSLYLLIVALLLYGIKTKNTAILLITIFVGPFAKESFIFIAPLLFFSHIPKNRLVIYLLASAVVVFGFHYLYDVFNGNPVDQGLQSNVRHIRRIKTSLLMLMNGRGLFEILSVFGVWTIAIIYASFLPAFRLAIKIVFTNLHACFFIAVYIHILLSNEYSRMSFIAMPVFCLILAFAFKEILRKHFPSLSAN
jgi:hypothetical protein